MHKPGLFEEQEVSEDKLADSEMSVLDRWFDFLLHDSSLGQADLIIYLKTTPQTALWRLRQRSRDEEKVVSIEYLEAIHAFHESWLSSGDLAQRGGAPVLTIEADVDITKFPDLYSNYEMKIFDFFKISSFSSGAKRVKVQPLSPICQNVTRI